MTAINDRRPGFDSFVGSEIDVTATWKIRPWLNVLGGYGHFFRGDYIKSSLAAVGGSKDADFLYAQAVFNF